MGLGFLEFRARMKALSPTRMVVREAATCNHLGHADAGQLAEPLQLWQATPRLPVSSLSRLDVRLNVVVELHESLRRHAARASKGAS